MSGARWAPGDVVVWRETWRGCTSFTWPVRVVEDRAAEGERVLAPWPFPTGWEDWQPGPSWPVPPLPDA